MWTLLLYKQLLESEGIRIKIIKGNSVYSVKMVSKKFRYKVSIVS